LDRDNVYGTHISFAEHFILIKK